MYELENHLNLIRKIAWGYVGNSQGLEFDELVSEACIACLEAREKFNPAKSKESSFIYIVANNKIRSVLKRKEYTQHLPLNEKIFPIDYNDPEIELIKKESLIELLAGFSPNSKEIYKILTDPKIYMPTDKPRTCRGIIKRELRKRGKPFSQIWKSFEELKTALN